MAKLKEKPNNPRQVRLTADNDSIARALHEAYQVSNCETVSFNDFCNRVIEKGLESMRSDVSVIAARLDREEKNRKNKEMEELLRKVEEADKLRMVETPFGMMRIVK